jgi:hypothetical protein
MERSTHILNAATNLLGICLVIITGLTVTRSNDLSYADEIAWFAAFMFLISIAFAYTAIRLARRDGWLPACCDWAFVLGIAGLILSACVARIAFG